MPFEFKFDILSPITNQINKQYVDVSADFRTFLLSAPKFILRSNSALLIFLFV